MKIVAIFLVLALAGVGFYFLAANDPPRRGVIPADNGQMVLAARVKPCVIFDPDPSFKLVLSGFKTIRPDDRKLNSESARVYLALYTKEQAKLITVLAETAGELEWEPAHHCPYPTLRDTEEPYGSEERYQSVFLLKAKQNPFTQDGGLVLVARSKFLLFFRKMQVIAEYHEPISPERAKNIDLEPAYILSFLERADAACKVLFQTERDLKSQIVKLSSAGDSVSRVKLAKWLGEVNYPGHGR